MEVILARADDRGGRVVPMKGELMMDERKLEIGGHAVSYYISTKKKKVVDRHAMTGLTQLAIVTEMSVPTGVPVYGLFRNVTCSLNRT